MTEYIENYLLEQEKDDFQTLINDSIEPKNLFHVESITESKALSFIDKLSITCNEKYSIDLPIEVLDSIFDEISKAYKVGYATCSADNKYTLEQIFKK